MKTKIIILMFVLAITITFSNENIFADHGSGGGGGGSCSGDCSPPTLGFDNSGRQYVEKGFSINDESFEVEHFKQDIPTQTLLIDEPISISLKIYENSGPQALGHVGLLLGLEEKTISGVKVFEHDVKILWEQNFEGEHSLDVYDPKKLVSDIAVNTGLVEDAFGTEEKLNQITFTFTPRASIDTSVIIVEMWDYERNSWTNYFYDAIEISDSQFSKDEMIQNFPTPAIPQWIKNNALWWAEGQIDDDSFIQGIEFLIKEEIILVPKTESGPFDTKEIPEWIKNNALWWAEGQIDDDSFIQGLQFLIKKGIINI